MSKWTASGTNSRAWALAAVMGGSLAAIAASAADLEVQVRGPNGGPVADAVVTLHLVDRPTPAPRAAGSFAIDQQDIQFHPFVMVVPVGAKVSFLNHDPFRHHVYSFASAKKFELKLEQKQQDRSVLFDKAGVVPLGCNIHDKMIAFVDVVDTPWAAKVGADGKAVFHNLPTGAMTVTVWHPYLRAPGNHVDRTVPLMDGAVRREGIGIALRSPPRAPAISDY